MPFVQTHDWNSVALVASADLSITQNAVTSRLRRLPDYNSVQLSRIDVGDVTYPIRRTLQGRYYRSLEQFLVDGWSPAVIGHGESESIAIKDFELRVHSLVQELLAKRPFEFSEDDKQALAQVERYIDLTVFRNTHPVRTRQFGIVSKVRPFPTEIKWENGSIDAISLESVANAEFVNFKAGQPLEAIVERDPRTFRLMRIVHVVKRSPPRQWTKQEELALMNSIGSASNSAIDNEWRP
jgi:hypothetical protein